MRNETLASLLQTLPYHINVQLPIWAYIRFSTEERYAIDVYETLSAIGQKPVPPMVWEAMIGKELFDKVSAKWSTGYRFNQRGYQVDVIVLDDYSVPLDDSI